MPKIANLLAAVALAMTIYAGLAPLAHAVTSPPAASAQAQPTGIGWD